jgi:hypothetical protein
MINAPLYYLSEIFAIGYCNCYYDSFSNNVILINSNVLLLVIDRSNGAKSTTCPKDGAIYTAVFSLFLSSNSGNSGQLFFILRPAGQPFSRPSSQWSSTRPRDGRNMYVLIHAMSFSYHNNSCMFVRKFSAHIFGSRNSDYSVFQDDTGERRTLLHDHADLDSRGVHLHYGKHKGLTVWRACAKYPV